MATNPDTLPPVDLDEQQQVDIEEEGDCRTCGGTGETESGWECTTCGGTGSEARCGDCGEFVVDCDCEEE